MSRLAAQKEWAFMKAGELDTHRSNQADPIDRSCTTMASRSLSPLTKHDIAFSWDISMLIRCEFAIPEQVSDF